MAGKGGGGGGGVEWRQYWSVHFSILWLCLFGMCGIYYASVMSMHACVLCTLVENNCFRLVPCGVCTLHTWGVVCWCPHHGTYCPQVRPPGQIQQGKDLKEWNSVVHSYSAYTYMYVCKRPSLFFTDHKHCRTATVATATKVDFQCH